MGKNVSVFAGVCRGGGRCGGEEDDGEKEE